MPSSFGDFPSHRDMMAYLESYADAFDLRRTIRFRSRVEEVRPDVGAWRVTLQGGSSSRYDAVVANGYHWEPRWPPFADPAAPNVSHAHAYRVPAPFAANVYWWSAPASRRLRSRRGESSGRGPC